MSSAKCRLSSLWDACGWIKLVSVESEPYVSVESEPTPAECGWWECEDDPALRSQYSVSCEGMASVTFGCDIQWGANRHSEVLREAVVRRINSRGLWSERPLGR